MQTLKNTTVVGSLLDILADLTYSRFLLSTAGVQSVCGARLLSQHVGNNTEECGDTSWFRPSAFFYYLLIGRYAQLLITSFPLDLVS